MTTPTTPAADAVREAFEDWVRKQDWFEPYFLYRRDMAGSTRIGQYVQGCIEITWGAWQSATARESALVADRDALRAALLQAARDVEDLKRPVHMDDPESPQAARNSLYMSIAAKALGALADTSSRGRHDHE